MAMDVRTRTIAVQRTIDKFKGKAFTYGSKDCAHLVGHLLVQLGHADPFENIDPYRNAKAAYRQIRKLGYSSLDEVLEQRLGLEAIAPASALPGDIVAVPSLDDPRMPGLGFVVDHIQIMGFGRPADAPDKFVAWFTERAHISKAWRANPKVMLWEPLSAPPQTINSKIVALVHEKTARTLGSDFGGQS